jgi:hypothetical protein
MKIILLSGILFISFSCNNSKSMKINITMGEAKYDTASESFDYSLFLNTDSSTLSLSDFFQSELSQANQMAITIKNWLALNLERSKEFACSKLIDLRNDNWLQQNEVPVTKEEFLKKMKFDGINAFKDGGFEIYFTDSNLFGGHWIMVEVTEKFELEDADIRG